MGKRALLASAAGIFAFAFVLPAMADDPTISSMMKERLEARKTTQAIGNESRNATTTLQAEASGISTVYYDLQRPAPDAAQVEEMKKRVEELKRREADLKAEMAAL